jgi:hypothetical protein
LYLDTSYLSNGATRVISKGFEVHNTTNKLNVGGAVIVYRNTAASVEQRPSGVAVLRGASSPTTICASYPSAVLPNPPLSAAEAFRIPGAQQWEAKDGCYVVAVRSSQTNDPVEDETAVLRYKDSGNTSASKTWVNAGNSGIVPFPFSQNFEAAPITPMLISPFFQCGAYFTGLPAGSKLTVNLIYIIERFVNAQNSDLVLLTNPSPCYDPVAMELYSRAASHLPHGTKVRNNADGDWIKSVADVLSTFGVPGMPLVKGAVDVWNGIKPVLIGDNKPQKQVSNVQTPNPTQTSPQVKKSWDPVYVNTKQVPNLKSGLKKKKKRVKRK